jgi:hypothetical protein
MTTEEALAEIERMKAEYRAAVKAKEKADRERKKKEAADELQLLKDSFNKFLIREGLQWLSQWVTKYQVEYGPSVKLCIPGHGSVSAEFVRRENIYVPRSEALGKLAPGEGSSHTWAPSSDGSLAGALAHREIPKQVEE